MNFHNWTFEERSDGLYYNDGNDWKKVTKETIRNTPNLLFGSIFNRGRLRIVISILTELADIYRNTFAEKFIHKSISAASQVDEMLKNGTHNRHSFKTELIESPQLSDYADGCPGHFCIQRYNISKCFTEFYNKGKWCSVAEVFTTEQIISKLLLLNSLSTVNNILQ